MKLVFRVTLLAFVFHVSSSEPSVYQVGVGIADVTGPAADINMVSFSYLKRVGLCTS